MLTLSLFQATTEPPPSGWVAVADLAVKHAEQRPDAVLLLLAILGPVLVGFGTLFVAVKYGLPFAAAHLEAHRRATAEIIARMSADAREDGAAARELSKSQQDAIVSRVESEQQRQTGQIAKIDGKLDRHGELLSHIAAKIGAGVIVALLTLGAAYAAHVAIATATAKGECPNGCGAGFYCCGEKLCCEQKKGTASLVPTSEVWCDRGHDIVPAAFNPAGVQLD